MKYTTTEDCIRIKLTNKEYKKYSKLLNSIRQLYNTMTLTKQNKVLSKDIQKEICSLDYDYDHCHDSSMDFNLVNAGNILHFRLTNFISNQWIDKNGNNIYFNVFLDKKHLKITSSCCTPYKYIPKTTISRVLKTLEYIIEKSDLWTTKIEKHIVDLYKDLANKEFGLKMAHLKKGILN